MAFLFEHFPTIVLVPKDLSGGEELLLRILRWRVALLQSSLGKGNSIVPILLCLALTQSLSRVPFLLVYFRTIGAFLTFLLKALRSLCLALTQA